MLGLNFDPAKDFFDPLADTPACTVTWMSRGAIVNLGLAPVDGLPNRVEGNTLASTTFGIDAIHQLETTDCLVFAWR